MQHSRLEQYRVADFLSWEKDKALELNPHFQRRAVWTRNARSHLVETVLRGYPMPKVFMRTKIDLERQVPVREIVDGQQRVRAILDFASGKFGLNARGGAFAGRTYSDLDSEQKEDFLAYAVAVEQLVGASDQEVLDIFSRLNTYSVPLNHAEQRHAKYHGDFKSYVRELSLDLDGLWVEFGILTARDRIRMLDDELTAQLFGVLIDGITSSGATYINSLYQRFDDTMVHGKADKKAAQWESLTDASSVPDRVRSTVDFIVTNLSLALHAGFYNRPSQFLMLFGVVAHLLHRIPPGDLGHRLPDRVPLDHVDLGRANGHLVALGEAVRGEEGEAPPNWRPFVTAASGGQTTRMPSRAPRFAYTWDALLDRLP